MVAWILALATAINHGPILLFAASTSSSKLTWFRDAASHGEAVFQVVVEAFDLTFGLRPIRPANFRREAVALGQIQQRGIPTMLRRGHTHHAPE